MAVSDARADQLRLPRGRMAALTARRLNRRNGGLIERTLTALDVRAGQRVLDVGFGGALSLRLLLRQGRAGEISGLEPSPEMVRRAERIFPEAASGRLTLRIGTAANIAFPTENFDRVLTCQTVYFWPDVAAGLAEIKRVLAPGGRLAVAMMPKRAQERFRFAERGYHVISHDDLRQWLEEAGFIAVATWPPDAGPDIWIVTADKP